MELIKRLQMTNSKIEKVRLLKQATEFEKKVLYYTYNPNYRYGIRQIDFNLNHLFHPDTVSMFQLLDDLRNRKITGDTALAKVKLFSEEFGDLICLIVRKDLCCGINATTINKAIPNLIPQFKVQLAKEVPLNTLKYPMYAQIKYDGVRVIAIIKGDTCILKTRNGKEINCPDISQQLVEHFEYLKLDGIILDGELTSGTSTMTQRTKISGRVNSAIMGGKLSIEDLTYNVFDIMTDQEFENCDCWFNYEQRQRFLNDLELEKLPFIVIADNKIVHTDTEANEYYDTVYSLGYEGLILKPIKHMYTFKRSKDWVKVKAIKTVEVKCIGFEYGEPGTKYEGYIGALVYEGDINGYKIIGKVGSGLSDAQRKVDCGDYIGETIELKYNEIIPRHDGKGYSLFLPRFVCVRLDK